MLVSRLFQLSLEVFNVLGMTGRSFNKAGIGGCKLFVGDTKSLSTASDDIANSYLEREKGDSRQVPLCSLQHC